MSEREWDTFFELLGKIVMELEGTWQDKRHAVLEQCESADMSDESNVREFANWFTRE